MARHIRKSRADNRRWDQMVGSLRLMNMAFNNARLYPITHAEVVGVLAKLHETLQPIFHEQDDIGYGFMDELLYLEGSMCLEETANNQMLVDRFAKCRVKYLTIAKGVTLEEFQSFFHILNSEAVKPSTEHPSELLAPKGVQHVHIIEAELDDTASKSKLAKRKTLLDWYARAVDTLRAAQEGLRDGPEPDLKPLFRVIDDLMATVRSKGHEPFLLLPALSGGFDPHVAHGVNTGILCCALGDLYGLSTGQTHTLTLCAFLHDLGRITIPAEWTQDPAPLGPEDRAIARQHADWGYLLLTRDKELPPQVGILAGRHHAPAPLGPAEGYFQDVYHRILAVADAYDLAAWGERHYWRKHRADRVLKSLLRRSGRPYDPAVVRLLAASVGFWPVGTLVRLDDGQTGIVVRPNPANPGRPKVWLHEAVEAPGAVPSAPGTAGSENDPPAEPAPVIADLLELNDSGTGFRRSIVGTLDAPGDAVRQALDSRKEHLLSFSL